MLALDFNHKFVILGAISSTIHIHSYESNEGEGNLFSFV